MGFCKLCSEETKWVPEEGTEMHAADSRCTLAVEHTVVANRLKAIREAVAREGARFVVVESERARGQERGLSAVRNGHFYPIDYAMRDKVTPLKAYEGVFVQGGMGEQPWIQPVTDDEDDAGELRYVALDPDTAKDASPLEVGRAWHGVAAQSSPLVFEVRRDRGNQTRLIAVIVAGQVRRVTKKGVRYGRGPFSVDWTCQPGVKEGDVLVGVPANARFTHVYLDPESGARAQRLLHDETGLALQVSAWDAGRDDLLRRTEQRFLDRHTPNQADEDAAAST